MKVKQPRVGRALALAVIGLLLVFAALVLTTVLPRCHAPIAADSRALELRIGSLQAHPGRLVGTRSEILDEFVREVTNAAVVSQWQGWAREVINRTTGKPHDSPLFDGVALGPSDFPDFLPRRNGVVAAAVIAPGGTNDHVNICWGGHDLFYGVLVGEPSFREFGSNALSLALGNGFYAYLVVNP